MSELEICTLLSDGRLIRSGDLEIYGLYRISLISLVEQGILFSPSWGVYLRSDVSRSPLFDVAVLSLRIPIGIWGLETALRIHLGHYENLSLWMRLPKGKKRYPTISEYELSFVSRAESMFSCGLASTNVHGIDVRYTDFANTVAECCVFRNRIGIDVFLTALKAYMTSDAFDGSYFDEVCRLHRVQQVILPYMQSIRGLL